jgi:glycosyltransferase involved in cell wall biosynthesis
MKEYKIIDLCLSNHPIWASLIEKPPEGIHYRIFKSNFYSKIYFRLANIFPFLINPTHFCNGAKPLKSKPWVVDLESVKVFFKKYEDLENIDAINKTMERLEKSRKILPLSEAAKKTIIRYLNIDMNKIEVVYPAIKIHRTKPIIRKKGTINILFIGGAFEAKGGREVLAAFKKIARKDVKLTIVGNFKEEYLKSIRELNIEAYKSLPRSKILNEIYPKADIFVMPSFMDTVGYVYLEAMSFGIPIIYSDYFAAPELVGDAGIKVKLPISLWREDGSYNPDFWKNLNKVEYFEEVADKVADAMHIFIEDFELRFKKGAKGIKRVVDGPVSISKRNNKLKEIYEKYLF